MNKLNIVPYGQLGSVVAPDPKWHEVLAHHYRLDDPEYDYQELIELSTKYLKDNKPTAWWRIERIRRALDRLPHSPRFFREENYWPRLEKALLDPGVNRMFQEEVTDGLHSEFLAPSYALMPSAVTLEMPFQHCINLKLEMAEVTDKDPYHRISLVEEGYQYTRIRTATTAELLTRLIRSGDVQIAVVLNCGRMLEFRYFPELKEAILRSNVVIYANDTDPSLKLEELIPDEEYRKHFKFRHATNSEVLDALPKDYADIVVSMGHAIYSYTFNKDGKNLDEMFSYGYLKEDLIGSSLRVLRPRKKFLFDLQPISLEWQKLLLSLSWLRGKGMNIALPPQSLLILFMDTLFADCPAENVTAYEVGVRADRGIDIAGYYITVTK